MDLLMFLLCCVMIFMLVMLLEEDLRHSVVYWVVLIVVCFMFGWCVNYMCSLNYTKKWAVAWETNIVALKDNQNIDGKFHGNVFVSSGYVDQKLYYYCMEKTADGNHSFKITSDNTFIKEDNNERPRVVYMQEVYADEKTRGVVIDSEAKEKYIIYVPEKSVDKTFSIDME